MKKPKTPVWKGMLAVLTMSLALSSGVPAFAADSSDAVQSAVTESSSAVSEQAAADDSVQSESTESIAETDSVSEDTDETTGEEAKTDTQSGTESVTEETETPLVSDDDESQTAVATVDMFRFYNPNSGEHFYTHSQKEGLYLRNHGWSYEGIGWSAPETSNSPVYRLYNQNSGDHHYTMAIKERDYLVSQGWKYEGIGWYSDDQKRIPLYRQYNPNAKSGSHNYTSAQNEANYLISNGWNDEGIGWYAVLSGRKGNAAEDLGAVTVYNGTDYSSIYDYSYYVANNADLASISDDDEKVLQHFATYGILENRQAKDGVLPTSAEYQALKKEAQAKKTAAAETADLKIANQYDSNTNYLILVNRSAHKVYIYQGNSKKGNWKKIKEWACGDGKASTPTPEGVFMIYGHTYMFGEGSHEFYASFFYGSYYFHSVIYSPAATTPTANYITDARLGQGVSHGCVRLATENAKWIYDNIPIHTTVVVTHW